ncbi:uncharacterized protein RCC_03009 [Ramularia collo-cygni]|uniref:Adenosine deaminase domain-containing protein n=1 Tax=Ramularia collo-cygni TaxID=112498 RepID=A0A2D3UXY6_9PEZI|nr:uncharacterized protein RCC_03009 [Ramularia collo-cygni]CZT17177.1 uncharacterized protein RCC_03009 [Ramularia collo-cygni]
MCIGLVKDKLAHWKLHTRTTIDGTDVDHKMENVVDPVQNAKATFARHVEQSKASKTYAKNRDQLLTNELKAAWDWKARSSASSKETEAGHILIKIREHERNDESLYGNIAGEAVPKSNTRDMGGRFLVNRERIEKSRLFQIAKEMPKGAHLHLHFNTALPPGQLLMYARNANVQQTMFIRSNRPLLQPSDFSHVETEIVLSVLPHDWRTERGNIFSQHYEPDWASRQPRSDCWMNFVDFRNHFPQDLQLQDADPEDRIREEGLGLDLAERWVCEKMIVTISQAYGDRKTTNAVWACFNQGTRALKGLTNYESAYRSYVGDAIDSMISDKVMYAELRDMLFKKTITSDDGKTQLDHFQQMHIVCEEISRKREQLPNYDVFPFGLKIIYSAPRSISRDLMQQELQNCLRLKLAFPNLICGFDLVGAEDRKFHIGHYSDLLLAFSSTCQDLNISIPFMFHAGESLLDAGGSNNPDNSNLYDSLLLNAKRVGHGYALLNHPGLVEEYKKRKICVELCPVSNELLGLCGNVREHGFRGLLGAGLECCLNADNPSSMRGRSLQTSSLSHEFYQVLVGDLRMGIHGWKQLAIWSLEHARLDEAQLKQAMSIFQRDWEAFCGWVIETYAEYAKGLAEIDLAEPKGQ